jgi:hypothetical protein
MCKNKDSIFQTSNLSLNMFFILVNLSMFNTNHYAKVKKNENTPKQLLPIVSSFVLRETNLKGGIVNVVYFFQG